MKLIKSKKAIVLLAMSIVAIVAAVGAYAYFTTTGSGSGTATVGTSSNLALVGSSASTLYPGGPSSDVTFTADNTSPGHQQLGTIYLASVQAYPTALDRTNGTNVISGCGSVDPGNAATNAGLSDFYMHDVVANQDFGPLGSPQAVTQHGTLVMNNLSASQDACKLAFLKLNLSTRP